MRAVLALVATLGVLVFNYLAATGRVNGVTPDVISDKYATVLTPSGYAFSIWSLIYLGMAAFSVYQILPVNLARFRAIRSLYIFTCLLNCGWIYFWHREQIGICLMLILALIAAIALMLILFRRTESFGGALFTSVPFGLYAGWISAAAFVNLLIFLKHWMVELSDFAESILGVLFILIAAGMAIAVRLKLRNFFYPLAVAWALTAIAVKQGGHTGIVVACALGVVICLVTAGSVVTELKDSTSE